MHRRRLAPAHLQSRYSPFCPISLVLKTIQR